MDFRTFVSYFTGVTKSGNNQYIAFCPHHRDARASLSIGIGRNGNILLHCQAGCSTKDILDDIGLTFADLYPDGPAQGSSVAKKEASVPHGSSPDTRNFDFRNVIATYDYNNGTRKLRDKNKAFMWQRLEHNQWVCGRGDAEHVLYLRGHASDTLYLVEGEKDVDTASRLGLYAASGENGAGGTGKWLEAYTDQIKELGVNTVYIVPDNDAPGKNFALEEFEALKSVAKEVWILDLSRVWADIPLHGDLSDMVKTFGGRETLRMLAELRRRIYE